MKKYLIVALLASLLAGCAHDSPCVPVYDSQGRLVHTNTCMKGTTEDNLENASEITWGASAVAGLTLGIVALTRSFTPNQQILGLASNLYLLFCASST